MSNGILVSVLKQGDGHVPSTRTVAGRYFRESMKNPRLNGHNRTMLISRFIVQEDFYSFESVSRDDVTPFDEKAKERMAELARLSARFMKSERSNLTGNSL